MDSIVEQAMQKWPNVPHCYGWLGLDARGNWYMRDDAAQARGAFVSGLQGAKGSMLKHDKLIAFIERNYGCDGQGQWYFQNGPQRVYVELEATPWVLRVDHLQRICTHDGRPTQCIAALVDTQGWLYLQTPLGLGVVHTQDMVHAAEAIASGLWSLTEVERANLPRQHGYVVSPQAAHKDRRAESLQTGAIAPQVPQA
jgi:hypothetical protein